jgi:hypothetical protein
MSMHPGVVLALCGLLTFWFRLISAVHWSWFEFNDSGGPHAGVQIVRPTLRRTWYSFDQMLGGQGTMLLLAALGCVWAWRATTTSERLPFWKTLCMAATTALVIRVSALMLGPGNDWPGWRLPDILGRAAEIVLYLGVLVVSAQRHRTNSGPSEVTMQSGDAEPHHEDSP